MKKVKNIVLDILFIAVGSCIYAVCVNSFTAPNNIAPGGLTGISTLLNFLFGTPIGLLVAVLNVPVVIWAIIEIGYKLVIKTVAAILIQSVAIDVFGYFMPVYRGDMIVTALLAGVLEGVGLSLVFIRGATTGGSDMIARLLAKRFRHISMGKLMLAVDGVIVAASALVYKSIESGVYACVVIFVSTSIIDAILYGTDVGTGKLFFVMSPKADEIADAICANLDRGVTFLKSRGAYTKVEGETLLCAVRRFEVYRINELIRSIDRDAFVIVGDAGEISGEGFKPTRSDDKTLREIIDGISDRAKK